MQNLRPPIHLLQAFVAVAQAGGVTRAAERLHLTQGAVSRQVLELEDLLGVPLFDRVRKRLAINTAGRHYLSRVAPLLAQLESAALEVIAFAGHGGQLNLASVPTFGARWLIPRLPAFHAAHRGIVLNFVHSIHVTDLDAPGLDCAIRFGSGKWPGIQSHYIAGKEFVVVMRAPGERSAALAMTAADIARQTLIHHTSVPTAWHLWGESHRLPDFRAQAGQYFEQYTLVIQAVIAGLGVGLLPRCLVQEELDSGQLVMPLSDEIHMQAGFFLCHSPHKEAMPNLVAFRDWLTART
jgi:LysR family transcriptional regulator, glycine cleavage system transcriptional activator